MESNGSFIAVTNASISIVIGQIFDDKFLTDVDNFMNIFCGNIDKFNCELT